MPSTEIAQRVAEKTAAPVKAGDTVFDLIRQSETAFKRALPAQIDVTRFMRVAITTLRLNPQLLGCTKESVVGALMLSAQLGLEPGGPLGEAYLVPFGKECTFIPGYRGLIKLARQSQLIANVYAYAVFEGDDFAWSLGLEPTLTHKATAPERDDATKITHVYAVGKFRDGSEPQFIVLTRKQVEKYRKRSKQPNGPAWRDDYEAMALKTGVRRLSTWLPLTIQAAAAIAMDERTVTGPVDLEEAALDVPVKEEEPAAIEAASSEPTPDEHADAAAADEGAQEQKPEPAPRPRRRSPARDLHIQSRKTFDGDPAKVQDAKLDALILNASSGRTNSATKLSDEEITKVTQWLGDVENGSVLMDVDDDGTVEVSFAGELHRFVRDDEGRLILDPAETELAGQTGEPDGDAAPEENAGE